MWRRILAITQKETIQLARDRATLIALMVGTSVELILFAAAIHTDIKHIPMVVADQSLSAESRSYLRAFVQSDSFDIVSTVSNQSQVVQAIDGGQASLGMVIPPDFAQRVAQRNATVMLLVDGSSSFTSQSSYNAANAISQQYAVSLVSVAGQTGSPLNPHIQILYNPDLKDLWFITPAFLAMLLQAIAQNMTALSIAREREIGTIEAILVTPIRPFELVIAKMIPNLVLAFTNAVTLLIVGVVILGVPFRGSLLLFCVLSLLTVGCGLAMGLMISSAVQTQNQAQQLTALVNISGMFLGGIMFPAYALPLVLHVISFIFPMTYFIPIVRGIALKGIGINELWGQALALVILFSTLLLVATRLFRQRLD